MSIYDFPTQFEYRKTKNEKRKTKSEKRKTKSEKRKTKSEKRKSNQLHLAFTPFLFLCSFDLHARIQLFSFFFITLERISSIGEKADQLTVASVLTVFSVVIKTFLCRKINVYCLYYVLSNWMIRRSFGFAFNTLHKFSAKMDWELTRNYLTRGT